MQVSKTVSYTKSNGDTKTYNYTYNNTYICKSNRRKIYLLEDEIDDIKYAFLNKHVAKYIIAKLYKISPARVKKIIDEYLNSHPEDKCDEELPFFEDSPIVDTRIIRGVKFNYNNNNFTKKRLVYLYNLSRYMIDKIIKI